MVLSTGFTLKSDKHRCIETAIGNSLSSKIPKSWEVWDTHFSPHQTSPQSKETSNPIGSMGYLPTISLHKTWGGMKGPPNTYQTSGGIWKTRVYRRKSTTIHVYIYIYHTWIPWEQNYYDLLIDVQSYPASVSVRLDAGKIDSRVETWVDMASLPQINPNTDPLGKNGFSKSQNRIW